MGTGNGNFSPEIQGSLAPPRLMTRPLRTSAALLLQCTTVFDSDAPLGHQAVRHHGFARSLLVAYKQRKSILIAVASCYSEFACPPTGAQPVCGGDCHKDEKQNWRKRGPQEEVRRWHFNLAVPPDGSLSTESTRRQEPFNWINKTRTFQLDQQDDKNHLTGSTSQEPCNCFLCNHLHSSLYISTDWTIS
ncbi:hypothetical protein FOCC_FOCC004020 [Frankliniella occidentalis]|nr:hypothetical protein FOCC_FOCC004020 [Frankliniella occidentalis]